MLSVLTENGSVNYAHNGAPMVVRATGTFGGGTLAIRFDFGEGFVTEYEMTAAETRVFDPVVPCDVEITLSGATAPNLSVNSRWN